MKGTTIEHAEEHVERAMFTVLFWLSARGDKKDAHRSIVRTVYRYRKDGTNGTLLKRITDARYSLRYSR